MPSNDKKAQSNTPASKETVTPPRQRAATKKATAAKKKVAAKKKPQSKKAQSTKAAPAKRAAKKTSVKKSAARKRPTAKAAPAPARDSTVTPPGSASASAPVPEFRPSAAAPAYGSSGGPPGASLGGAGAQAEEGGGLSGFLALWGPLIIVGFLIFVFRGSDGDVQVVSATPVSEAAVAAQMPGLEAGEIGSLSESVLAALSEPLPAPPFQGEGSANLAAADGGLAVGIDPGEVGVPGIESTADALAAAFEDAGLAPPRSPQASARSASRSEPAPAATAGSGSIAPPVAPYPSANLGGILDSGGPGRGLAPPPLAGYPPVSGPYSNPWAPAPSESGTEVAARNWPPPPPAVGAAPPDVAPPGWGPPPAGAPAYAQPLPGYGPWAQPQLVPCPPPYFWCMAPRAAYPGW